MPAFKIEKKEPEVVAKASFRKKEDYMVVILEKDIFKRKRLIHKIQAEKLIKEKKAKEVKDAEIAELDQKITIKKSSKKATIK